MVYQRFNKKYTWQAQQTWRETDFRVCPKYSRYELHGTGNFWYNGLVEVLGGIVSVIHFSEKSEWTMTACAL